jgi:proteasome lid subunit RPN8/RPN11
MTSPLRSTSDQSTQAKPTIPDGVATPPAKEVPTPPQTLADRVQIPNQFDLANAVWDSVPREMPTAPNDELHLHGEFPGQGQVRVIISQSAIAEVDAHAHSDLGREVGGVLLGRVVRYQAQTFVEVLVAMPAHSNDHGPIHFTFSADTWSYINKQRDKHYPHLDIIGWFHTHPDLGVFYSSDDVVVHSAAFTLPWQVGLVVDPVRQEASFFGWENSQRGLEILPMAGFYEWLDNVPESQVHWQVAHYQHWAQPTSYEMTTYANGSSSEMLLPNPWFPVIVSVISLLISLGLLLDRLLTG